MQSSAPAQSDINFTLLRQHYRNQFVKYFEEKIGPKTLYMDQTILKVLSFVIGGLPESSNVQERIILSDTIFQPNNKTVLFAVRPDVDVVQQIIKQKDNWKKTDIEVYILFVPRRTIECDELLYENHLFQEDKIFQINMDLVPLEEDMLSLELPNNFKHHLLQDDDTYKVYVQYSIHRLESIYGKIEHKFALGKTAKQIITRIEQNTLNVDQSSGQQQSSSNQDSEIDGLIMIDRDVDLVSPFCVNQNYEGLLDEYFGIKTCSLQVDNKIVYPDEKVRKELKLKDDGTTDFILTSEDAMFHEIRNQHFNLAGPHLSRQIADIQRMIEDKGQQNIEELNKFIQKLKKMNIVKAKEIATSHINIAYNISQSQKNLDYIEIYSLEAKCIMGDELKQIALTLEAKMTKQYNKMKILRAMVIFSTTQGGLNKADFDNLRRVFIMNYGYQEIITLMNLQEAGLFKLKDKKAPGYFDWNWTKIKEIYNLVNDTGANPMGPSDISYVYNGYAPISVRLIQFMLENNGIQGMYQKNLLKPLGLTEDKIKFSQAEIKLFNPQSAPTPGMPSRPTFKKRKIMVYYLGGITYAEMAAIRFLTKLNPKYKFIICTTSIINGETALKQLNGPNPEEHGLLLGDLLDGKRR